MAIVAIGLGSNLGAGKNNLSEAWRLLTSLPGVTPKQLSSPYITSPVGMVSDRLFTNAVGVIETDKSCALLLNDLLEIEKKLGRDRTKGLDRTVDLDILYYDDLIVTTPELVVPHPGIEDRLFVLTPLNEIDPDRKHPVLGLTTRQLLAALTDTGQTAEKSTW